MGAVVSHSQLGHKNQAAQSEFRCQRALLQARALSCMNVFVPTRYESFIHLAERQQGFWFFHVPTAALKLRMSDRLYVLGLETKIPLSLREMDKRLYLVGTKHVHADSARSLQQCRGTEIRIERLILWPRLGM